MHILLKVIFFVFLSVVSTQANEKISLQLLWKHQFEFAGFYIAKEKGLYEKAGLDVHIKEYDFGMNIVSDVLNGQADIGIGRSSLVLDKLNGIDITLLSTLYQNSPYVLISKKREDLQSVNDFKNKKIMLSDAASVAAISSLMQIHQIKDNDYIKVPHSFNIHDLIDDKVDLMTIYLSNEPHELQEKGIEYTIFDPKDEGFSFYADILFTSNTYLKKNKNNIHTFQEISRMGWEYAFSNIEETVDLILQKYNSQNKTREALLFEAHSLKKLAYDENNQFGLLDELRIKEIANIYRLLGMTKKTNEHLKDFVYKKENIFERIFRWEVFLTLLLLVVIGISLTLYRQYTLKKQNKLLEDAVNEKTASLLEYTKKLEESEKELQSLNQNLELKIQERTQSLEIATRAKSDFLANMSHEIRTPLNGIIGFIDILYKAEKDAKKSEQLTIVKESGNLLLHIINDILDFSKIESNKMSIEKIPVNLHDIFTHVVDLFFSKAKERDINIQLTIDKGLPLQSLGDSTRLKQILSNLLSNAIKFSYEHTQIQVNISYLEDEDKLYCEVIDEGKGISPEHSKNIFRSFEQADSSVTRIHGGTGLGLSISKSLVELMGGEIGLESELEKGSKFYFTIKLFEVLESIHVSPIESVEDIKFSGKVLIVEDNKTNQMLLSMLLDDLELDIDVANDGLEAVEAVKKETYDVILMDENMPNMNGKEATKIIRSLESSKDTPIIAVTANALKGDKEKFLASGMNDYIAKPIDADELTIILSKYL